MQALQQKQQKDEPPPPVRPKGVFASLFGARKGHAKPAAASSNAGAQPPSGNPQCMWPTDLELGAARR